MQDIRKDLSGGTGILTAVFRTEIKKASFAHWRTKVREGAAGRTLILEITGDDTGQLTGIDRFAQIPIASSLQKRLFFAGFDASGDHDDTGLGALGGRPDLFDHRKPALKVELGIDEDQPRFDGPGLFEHLPRVHGNLNMVARRF